MARIHTTYRGLHYALRSAKTSDNTDELIIYGGSGAPSGGTIPGGQVLGAAQSALYLREDGTAATTIYVTVNGGTDWTAITADDVATAIADAGTLAFGAGSDVVLAHDGSTGVQVRLTDNDADALEFKIGTSSVLGGFDTTNDAERFELMDGVSLALGTGGDDVIGHSGTSTTWTHTTGDLTVDNQAATGSTVFTLGSDTNATSFEIANNSGTSFFKAEGDSKIILPDSVSLELGASTDDDIAHNGTNTVWTHKTGDLVIDNTLVTGSTIFQMGTDTNACSVEVKNNTGTVLWAVTADGTTDVSAATMDYYIKNNEANALTFEDSTGTILNLDTTTDDLAVQLPDSVDLEIGDGADFSIVHGGTNTDIVSKTGDLNIDNQSATGSTVFVLGADTNAVDLQVQNNSAASILTVFGDSTVTLSDSVALEFGDSPDDSLTTDGSDFTWTHSTGDLTIDNTAATGSTIFVLGSDTSATDFQIQNDSAAAKLAVTGAGALSLTTTVVNMANAKHTMVYSGAEGAQTNIAGPLWMVDANGGAQILVLPTEATSTGMFVMVVNTGGETVTVKDDAEGYVVFVLEANESGLMACDGTTWYGFMGAET